MADPRSTRATWLVGAVLLALSGCAKHVTPFRPANEVGERGGAGRANVSGLDLQLDERFYAVSGLTPTTLNGALARLGPTVRGRKVHAVTEWRVSWSYEPVWRGSRCAIRRPRVSVHVVTTLPRWLNVDEAPASLANDWGLFLERLRHHESEHQDIAMKSGRELLAVLAGLEADDCQLLERVAKRVAAGVAANHDAQHQSFDVSTDYGLMPSEG
jgi:predicted secreted Zn-dependent protease